MSALTHVYPEAKGSDLAAVSTVVLPANPNRNFLLIQNNNAALTLGVRLDGGVAVINGSNTITLPAGATMLFDVSVPMGAISAIPSGVGGKIVIYEG